MHIICQGWNYTHILFVILIHLHNCPLRLILIFNLILQRRKVRLRQMSPKQKKWKNHDLVTDSRAPGLPHSVLPLPSRRGSSSKAAEVMVWRKLECSPCPRSSPMACFLAGVFCLHNSQSTLLQGLWAMRKRVWICQVAIKAEVTVTSDWRLVSVPWQAVEIFHLCPLGITFHEDGVN